MNKNTSLVLTAKDILALKEEGELLVGGKNFNTAYISALDTINTPQFRAISSVAFHRLLDETTVNSTCIRTTVEQEYSRTDWEDAEIYGDPEFLPKFVRNLALQVREAEKNDPAATRTKLRTFINNTLEGFATSTESIDFLRKRSVIVQVAILSVELPEDVSNAVAQAYLDICKEAGKEVSVAVRSSAAGEDSRKKAFAGLQDTYLNIQGTQAVVRAYHWDCASAYNLRSMTYRREAILDAMRLSEETGDERIMRQAKDEWAIENTSLSVCIMRMVDPVVSGTAFSADTATGFRGTHRDDLISVDASYGLGESVVGGMVTPDKFYVYEHENGNTIILRYMGSKEYAIVRDAYHGTKRERVPADKVYAWSLTDAQLSVIAKGVRSISELYGGMIVDTEFCIDNEGALWFVQARPETRWNEERALHPTTIFMKHRELDPVALASAELLLEGNGASRGAGTGVVRFLRSALELNKVSEGDILVAERTDPDMVPGMRIASAILANVGGDTSHAAITSRELGIPAVIGIQRIDALRALDGLEVTVDGTHGRVYRGMLPLRECGTAIDTATIPATKTGVGLILADVGQSLFLSRLRDVADFEVGLLRAEFMLGNIGVHPLALEAYDTDTLDALITEQDCLLEQRITKLVKQQVAEGSFSSITNLRQYTSALLGIDKEIADVSARTVSGSEQMHRQHLAIRALEHQLDLHTERAVSNVDVLQSSADIKDHVRAVLGENVPEEKVELLSAEAMKKTIIQEHIRSIELLRENVAKASGLWKERRELLSIRDKIAHIIRASGSKTGREYYIRTLSQGLALFAMAFSGRSVLYRTTDFKSNEYRNLLGGMLFEDKEDNPMLGYRGVARGIHPWEVEAFKLARSVYNATNLQLMFPFVRTIEEARAIKHYLKYAHGLCNGNGLSFFIMSEIPSNAILAKDFIMEFDGFSIGSNDMTQTILATDRDNARLRRTYDEEDPAVIWAILVTIFTGQKYGKKVGFCGQGVSNSDILRGVVSMAGITVASVVPDTYVQTKEEFALIEKENLGLRDLSSWMKAKFLQRIREASKAYDYSLEESMFDNDTKLLHWYETVLQSMYTSLEAASSEDTVFVQEKIEHFQQTFHKLVIYATWDWDSTIKDAMLAVGFASFEEQEEAYKKQQLHLKSRK